MRPGCSVPGGRPCAPAQARRGDRGSGAVLVLALASVAVLFAVLAALLGGALVARHRAEAAADLAALAAAAAAPERVSTGGGPCERARAIAEAQGGRLAGCRVLADSTVLVRAEVPVPAVRGVVASAVARAGAPPDPPATGCPVAGPGATQGADRPPRVDPPVGRSSTAPGRLVIECGGRRSSASRAAP